MSTRKDGSDYTHTDHTDEIRALRVESDRIMRTFQRGRPTAEPSKVDVRWKDDIVMTAFAASAALLEVHDATGISLDNWAGPKQLVKACLRAIGLDGTFLENEV